MNMEYQFLDVSTWLNQENLSSLGLLLLFHLAVFLWYRKYLKVRVGTTLLLWLLSVLLGIVYTNGGFYPFGPPSQPWINGSADTYYVLPPFHDPGAAHPGLYFNGPFFSMFNPHFFRWLFIVLVISFTAKLYLKWVGDRVTEEEKEPGLKGMQAWLGGGNLICAIMIALSGMIGFRYSLAGLLLITVLALILYPLITLITRSSENIQLSQNHLSEERERILKMLDEGKINAEESADLLNALRTSAHPQYESSPLSSARKLVLVGAGLVFIGFFLGSVSSGPPQPFNQGPGWLILLLALGVAFTPWLLQDIRPQTRQRWSLWSLLFGGLILAVLVLPYFPHLSTGVIFVLLGIVLQFIGVVTEPKTA